MKHYSNGHMTLNDYLMMYLARWKRVALVLLIIWIVVTYLFIAPLRCTGNSEEVVEFQERLRRVSSQLDVLKQQHNNLIAQIKKSPGLRSNLKDLDPSLLLDSGQGPTEEYENLRRRIQSNTKELWYYISHELGGVMKSSENREEKLVAIMEQINERQRSLLSDQEKLPELDGYHEWRKTEAANVSDLIQRRLYHLQNPPDCKDARKVICNLNKGCGFGCQLHHIVYCLIFAYATERTLILNSKGWRYNNKGWEYVFHPISDTCTSSYDDPVMQWAGAFETAYISGEGLIMGSIRNQQNFSSLGALYGWRDVMESELRELRERERRKLNEREREKNRALVSEAESDVQRHTLSHEAKVVSLPFIDSISQKPKFLPLAVPRDLAHRIIRFNGDPPSWWIGQILKYILKPRLSMQKAINDTIAKMNFNNPIVGVHIRRTDKVGTEAAFHHIHEYMAHVKSYYDQLELTRIVDTRRVYLATDDANVLEDARKKYPDYEFLGDPGIAKTAATHRRYTPASLTGLLLDLHMLAACDYLVCTFSSQVGRVAYEMMQANRVDASTSYFSLDDIYYFGGQNAHDRAAILPHRPASNQEIALQVGDLIGIAGNHWNGFGRGTNKRTNVNGLIPWYKTAEHLVLYPFPEYKHVPLYGDTRQTEL